MSAIQIPSELLELRQSIRDFVEREVKPVEAKYAQELQEMHRKVRQEPQPKGDTIYQNVFMDRDKVREGS